MYRKIMVTLDGSELSEAVLPHVEAVAGGCGAAEVVLVRVAEPVHLPAGAMTDGTGAFTEIDAAQIRQRMDENNKKDAAAYLQQVAGKLKLGGARAQTEVLAGKPAEKLTEYATKSGADLIIIATHGRSGVSHWAWGSVADKVLHSACVPVLMVRPPACVPKH